MITSFSSSSATRIVRLSAISSYHLRNAALWQAAQIGEAGRLRGIDFGGWRWLHAFVPLCYSSIGLILALDIALLGAIFLNPVRLAAADLSTTGVERLEPFFSRVEQRQRPITILSF